MLNNDLSKLKEALLTSANDHVPLLILVQIVLLYFISPFNILYASTFYGPGWKQATSTFSLCVCLCLSLSVCLSVLLWLSMETSIIV